MTDTNALYAALKGQAYPLAMVAGGRSNPEAQAEGFRDVYDLIMADSDHPRQAQFLMQLPSVLSEAQRQVLLDGWMAYVAQA